MALGLAGLLACQAFAGEISARWAMESSQAVVGQSLVLTLEIEGSDKVDPPALSVPGVEISFQGGGPHDSTSIVSINGRTTKTVRKSWIGSWALKSSTVGTYHLDAQNWNVGSETVFLPAINWQVTSAQKDSRFELRQSLSQNVCVPGIEIEYTLVWYIGQSVQNPEFTLPILDNPDLVPVESSFTPPAGDIFQIQYKGRVLTGTKSTERMNGQQVTALTIRFKVKPSRPGSFDLSGTMVSFQGAVDSQQTQDLFGNIINEPVYRNLTAQAQRAILTVKDLPVAGKPTPFSGLIGKLDLSWESAPGVYHVGEPIRLTLKLSGVLNKPNLDLDHMVTAALDGDDFQVSPDLAAKETEGQRSFIFRARHPGKMVVPPLTLNYFDPASGRYGSTATKPLSFDVAGSASSSGGSSFSGNGPALSGSQGSSSGGSLSNANAGTGNSGANNSSSRSGLAMMNPNGLSRSVWPSIPWWAFGVPGFALGLIVSLCALWRHSARRIRSLERKAWRAHLSPLASSEGRAALEEGRLRLQLLTACGELWRMRLENDGRWKHLEEQARVWDEAFFAESRDGEPWTARWDELVRVMEDWK